MKEIRKEIRLDTLKEAIRFANIIIDDGQNDKYVLQDQTGGRIADAKTILGVVYAASEFDKIYLVNLTHNGIFPSAI